jgi:hypothetical protein
MNDLYVFACEPRSTQLNLSKVCNSWSIINDLCAFTFEPRSTQLGLFKVYNSWNIINGLFVYAFDLVCGLIEYFVLLLTICFVLSVLKYKHQGNVMK